MNVKNIHEILSPKITILDAKSMDSHEKLKCEVCDSENLYKKLECVVCGSGDLTIGNHEIVRGFENYIKLSIFCNNCENWQEVIINDFDQNESYNDIVKGLDALEKEQKQLHMDLVMKLEEDLLGNKKTRKEKV